MFNPKWAAYLGAFLLSLAAFAMPQKADAFCGTYVSGGEADLFNNATQAVMMRHEKTTVLSMQNNYEGPPKDFAMIVPTPVVLEKKNVKTLEDEIFGKIDRLTAPRLVEYWEKDPCEKNNHYGPPRAAAGGTADSANKNESGTVKVEAEFAVGEYDVVVLSSNKSSALESWLHTNGYNIPKGAGPFLNPYIQKGAKFFVAKVNIDKVTFNDQGQAVLSPLRFHYESDEFKLPIRLGLINSNGQQDLIVNILAQNQRYRAANYPNATIPTNIEVVNDVKNKFPQFYRALFKETIRQNKNNGQNPIVTEYSWNAASCDPCPGPALTGSDIASLGGDVINDMAESGGVRRPGYRSGWVITRLHARYGADEIGKDIVFEKAPPIVGGRERYDEEGNLERGATEGRINNFQGRYIIRHRWDKAVLCSDPEYGRWGGPPGENHSGPTTQTAKGPNNGGAGLDDVESDEEPELSKNVRQDIPELGVKAESKEEGPGAERACSQTPFGDGSTLPLGLLALFGGLGLLRVRSGRR